jgi:cytochrome P450
MNLLVTLALCFVCYLISVFISPDTIPKTIKGPLRLPIVGSLLDVFLTFGSLNYFNRYILSLYKRYGWSARVKFLHQERVMLYHPADISAVYQSDGKYPRNVTASFPSVTYVDKLCGIDHMTLASTEGERWYHLRHKLAKHIFSPKAANSYLPYINPISTDISKLMFDNNTDINDIIPYFTCEVMGNIMFGKRLGTLDDNDTEPRTFAKNVIKFFHTSYQFNFEIPWYRLFLTPKFKRYLTMYQSMRSYARNEVNNVIDNINRDNNKDNNKDNNNTININNINNEVRSYIERVLADDKLNLSVDEISEGIITLFIGGVDATATAISVFLLYLAENQEVQEKLYDELMSVLGGDDYNESSNLTYLKCCIKEVNRIAPGVPGTIRVLNQDVTLHSGETLVKDTVVIICPAAVLQDSKYMDKPEQFIPERWFDEEREKRKEKGYEFIDNNINYIPFSFGPRMCIGTRLAGLEMTSLICRLIQDYKVTISSNNKDNLQSYEFISAPFTQAYPNPKLSFIPRN